MKFGDAFIDQVRNSVSIVDLISGYVHLKKKGKDYAALCPFHLEKTPSFLVSESKRIFKCFGCGAGGDVFKFLMLMENLTFPESVEHLAQRYGIPLPRSSETEGPKAEKRQRLLEAMELAAEFFSRRLEESAEALEYLRGRQITNDTIQQFAVGYAPPGQQLLEELKRQGFTIEDALACGLVKEREGGRHYDKFRNRIMFPIRDLSGRTIAFGGRVLGEGVPKYLNSPETSLYHKGSNLFPLHLSRDEIRRRDFAVLVEGYFDCIVPFQAGVKNVVASLGTSLTENQVKLLGRYTRNVVISYDPDSAGTAATLRSIDLFLEQGFRVNVLKLPGGEDPDTFIRKEGAAAYGEKLKGSQPYLDFALSQFLDEQRDPMSPKGKQEVATRILPYVARVANPIERSEYVVRIASRLQLDPNLLMLEMRKIPQHRNAPQLELGRLLEQVTPAENTLLVAALEEEWASTVLKQLDAGLFEGLRVQRIFEKVFQLKEEGRGVTAANLREVVDEEADRDLIEAAALRSSQVPLSQEMIAGSVQALRRKQYERLSREIQEEIKRAAQEDSASGKLDDLLIRKEKIRKQIKDAESNPSLGFLSPE